MSLIHRCDKCRKIIWDENQMTPIDGIGYNLEGNDKSVDKVKDQIIDINFVFTAQCGQADLELCDPCAYKMIVTRLKRCGFTKK